MLSWYMVWASVPKSSNSDGALLFVVDNHFIGVCVFSFFIHRSFVVMEVMEVNSYSKPSALSNIALRRSAKCCTCGSPIIVIWLPGISSTSTGPSAYWLQPRDGSEVS